MPNYLIVATSGRAIAQGLKALGYSAAVITGFADSDTCAAASHCERVKRTRYGLDNHEVLQAARSLQSKVSFDGLFYGAVAESNPGLLNEIDIAPVYGNSSQTILDCKNPEYFFSVLDKHSIPYPDISFKPQSTTMDSWLLKNKYSTGGLGVSSVCKGLDYTEDTYFQKKVDGINFSLTFLANEKKIFALGFNALWSEPLGDSIPYAYAGAINQVKLDKEIQETALQYTKVIADKFDLIGLNSIDFICANDSVYVLEVNPRIPATYELYETKYGELMQEHIEVCKSKILPTKKRQPLLRAHGIVYAPTDIHVPESMSWPLWTADRPYADEVIKQSEPVCSVFAGGQNSAQVYEMIKTRKQSILAKLAQ